MHEWYRRQPSSRYGCARASTQFIRLSWSIKGVEKEFVSHLYKLFTKRHLEILETTYRIKD